MFKHNQTHNMSKTTNRKKKTDFNIATCQHFKFRNAVCLTDSTFPTMHPIHTYIMLKYSVPIFIFCTNVHIATVSMSNIEIPKNEFTFIHFKSSKYPKSNKNKINTQQFNITQFKYYTFRN